MTKVELLRFRQHIVHDRALRQQVVALFDPNDSFYDGQLQLVALGAEHGFDFTLADVQQFFEEALPAAMRTGMALGVPPSTSLTRVWDVDVKIDEEQDVFVTPY